ncbi:MAG: hypothetical protein WC768_01040 [Patescibacteria group bacterium]|jgi:hypothetical protein
MNKDGLLDPQTSAFGGRLLTCLPAMPGGVAQDWFDFPEGLQEYLAGLATSPFVVRVDRLVKPVYPDWVKEVLHPELENTGPDEFNLKTDVALWLHDGQKNGDVVNSKFVYYHLRDNGMLPTCLNLQDGEAIRGRGIAVFRKFFRDKEVFLWKAVVQDCHGFIRVPHLREVRSQVVVEWRRLGAGCFGDNYPAARFTLQVNIPFRHKGLIA